MASKQFELPDATTVRVLDVVVLSQKNRKPDENPGAKIKVAATLVNDELALFDGHLRDVLYTSAPGAAPKQQALEGVKVVSSKPSLSPIGRSIGRFKWSLDLIGYRIVLAHGINGAADVKADGCTINGFTITPQEGGTALVQFTIEAPDVSAADFGRLAKLKRVETDLQVIAPEVRQRALGEQPKPTAAKKTLPKPLGAASKKVAGGKVTPIKSQARQTAEEAFAAAHTPPAGVQ